MNRKGLTPVIAVVLLLLITVGAVASAWGLYQQIIGDTSQLDQFQAQQQASDTSFEFASLYEDGGNISMSIINTGSRTVNLSDEISMYVIPPGSDGRLAYEIYSTREGGDFETDCLRDDTAFNEPLEVGESYECDTGLPFPDATDDIGIVLNYDDAENTDWSETCSPSSRTSITC